MNASTKDLLNKLIDEDTDEETRIWCAETLREYPYHQDVLGAALQLRETVRGELRLIVSDLCDRMQMYDLK